MGPAQRQLQLDEAPSATRPQALSSSFHFVSESQKTPRAPTHVSPFSFVHQASQETQKFCEVARDQPVLAPTVEDSLGRASLSVPLGLSPGMNAFYSQPKRQKTRRSNLIGSITLGTQHGPSVLREDFGGDLRSHVSDVRPALVQNVYVAENVEGEETRRAAVSELKDTNEHVDSAHSHGGGIGAEEHEGPPNNGGERLSSTIPQISSIVELHKEKALDAGSASSPRNGGRISPGRPMDGEYPMREISAPVSALRVENPQLVPVAVSLWKLAETFRTQLNVLQDQQAELFEEETQRAQPNLNCGLESIMKDIELYRAQQDACISQENFVEAERLDEIIQELEQKLFGKDEWDTESPFHSFLQLQKGLLDIASQWRQNIDSTIMALKETRSTIITDACKNVDFEVKRLAGDVERLKFETARLNLESEQLEAQSATIAVEWDQLQDYMTQQTQEDVALRNEVVKQKNMVDAEIEAIRKALDTKLKEQATLEEQIHTYDIKIGAARSKFQKQLKRLETSRTALAVARSEVEAERQQLQTLYVGVAENQAALERNLYKTIVDVGGVWLAISESEKGLIIPAQQLEELHRRAICVTETVALGDAAESEENAGRISQEIEPSLACEQEDCLAGTSKPALPTNSLPTEGNTVASTAQGACGPELRETLDYGKDAPPADSSVEPDPTVVDGLDENVSSSKACTPASSPPVSPRSDPASESGPISPPPLPPFAGDLLPDRPDKYESVEAYGKDEPSSLSLCGSSVHSLLRRLGEVRTRLEDLAKGIRLNRQEKVQITQRLEECRAQKTSVVAMRLFREAAALMREMKALEESVEALDLRFTEMQTALTDAGEIQRELENALAESRAADRVRRCLEAKRGFNWMRQYILELQRFRKRLTIGIPFTLFTQESVPGILKTSEGLSEGGCTHQQVLEKKHADRHERSTHSDLQWEALGYWVDVSLAKNCSSCLEGSGNRTAQIQETTQKEYARLLETHFIAQAVRSAVQESYKSWEASIAQEIDICSRYCDEWSRQYDIIPKEGGNEELGPSEDAEESGTSTAVADVDASSFIGRLDAFSSFSLMEFLEPASRALRHVNSVLALFASSKDADVDSSFPVVSTQTILEGPPPPKATDHASAAPTTGPAIKECLTSPLREATESVAHSLQTKQESFNPRPGTDPEDVSLGDEADTAVSGSVAPEREQIPGAPLDIPSCEAGAPEALNPLQVITENKCTAEVANLSSLRESDCIHPSAEVLQRITDLEEKLEEAVERNDFDTASLLDDELTYLKATHFPDLHVN